MSHLEEISDAGIAAMSQCGSIGVLLPTTAYILRLRQPPARKMIEKGIKSFRRERERECVHVYIHHVHECFFRYYFLCLLLGMAIALGSDFNPNAYCYSMVHHHPFLLILLPLH